MSVDAPSTQEFPPNDLVYPEDGINDVLENPELEDNGGYIQTIENEAQTDNGDSLTGASDKVPAQTIDDAVDVEDFMPAQDLELDTPDDPTPDEPEAHEEVVEPSKPVKPTPENLADSSKVSDPDPVVSEQQPPEVEEVTTDTAEPDIDQGKDGTDIVTEPDKVQEPVAHTASFKSDVLENEANPGVQITAPVLQKYGDNMSSVDEIVVDDEPLNLDENVANRLGEAITTSGENQIKGYVSDCLTFGTLLSGGEVVGTPYSEQLEGANVEWVPGEETHPIDSGFVPEPLQLISLGNDNLNGGVAFSHAVVRLPVEGNNDVYAHSVGFGQIVISPLASAAQLFNADMMEPMERVKVTLTTGEVMLDYDTSRNNTANALNNTGNGSRDGGYGSDGGTIGELHNSNIFDLDETTAGERINPATGEQYDNTTFTDNLHLFELGAYVVDNEVNGSEDVLGVLHEEDDEAAKWLREHAS